MGVYISNSDADVYFESRPNSANWDAVSDESKKTKYLTEATRLIDTLNFIGSKADEDQELEFPRGDDTVIPESIENACCEIAYALLSGRDVEYEHELLGSSASNSAGQLTNTVVNVAKLHGIPSVKAWMYLRPYLRDGSAITLSRVS
jgi:hypothetical protein